VGWGLDRRRDRRDAGGRFRSALVQVERGQDRERAVAIEAAEPAEIRAVQAGFPTHGKPESQDPA